MLKENHIYEFEDFQINFSERTLWHNGELIPLAPKVIETLCLLVENHGRLMTKDELMEELWADSFVEERNLTQNIFTLRKVLGEKESGKKFIETLPRRGYRFVAEVRPVETEEVIQVSHSKQTRITAEGFVSTQELTEAVKEIAKTLVLEKEIGLAQPKQIIAAKRKPFYKSVSFLAIGILAFLSLGIAFWFWQKDSFNRQPSNSAFNFEPAKLKFERLTESGNAFYPAISPDKQHIAYILNEKGKFSILLQNLATGSVTQIVPPKDYEIRSPEFSRDGNFLFYGARDGGQETTVYQTPIFGGSARKIVTNVNHNFTLSPEGEWLAFLRHNPEIKGNHLVVCRTDGSEERIVATHKEKTFFRVWGAYPAWSPDGKKIVTAVHKDLTYKLPDEKKSYFVEIDLADGSEKILNAPHWNVALTALWLADGSGLIVQVQDKPDSYFQLWHLAYPSGEARPLTNDPNNYTEFRLAPDSSFIIASEEKTPHNLQLISAKDSTQVHHLTNSTTTQRGFMGLEWTPDGKELIYLQLEGLVAGNIWKMNVETLEAAQLTFDKGAWNRHPDVTPDGNSIVFASNRTGKWHIWQMDMDGGNLRQITDGIGENYPQVSPDGNWLVYVTPGEKPNSLWKMPLSGGEPVKILQNAGGLFHISPDSRQIVASYYDPEEKNKNPWKYVIAPFDGVEKPQDTGFWSQAQVVRWKPDGSGIYFLSTGQSHTNIWFYSVIDKSKRPVTNFDSQEIINLSISPDGNTFAVARGTKASNLLKISGFN